MSREQLTGFRLPCDDVFTHLERRQIVSTGREPEIGGRRDRHSPRGNPSPVVFDSVVPQPIDASLGTIVNKPARQHLGRWHDSQKLGVIANLRHVVWGWCRGTGEAIRRPGERLNQLPLGCPGVRLQNGRFVQANSDELAGVEVMQLVVVRDRNTGLNIRLRLGNVNAGNPELVRFGVKLPLNRQRAKNQDVAACVLIDDSGPFQHLNRLAESAVLEQCGTTTANRPLNHELLPVERFLVDRVQFNVKPCRLVSNVF